MINPTRLFFESTTGSFSILCFLRTSSASSNDVPDLTVIRFFDVITLEIGLLSSFSNLKSLFVTIPLNFPLSDIIGIPPILYFFIYFFASLTYAFSFSVTGSIIIPDSALFTSLTSFD